MFAVAKDFAKRFKGGFGSVTLAFLCWEVENALNVGWNDRGGNGPGFWIVSNTKSGET